MEESLRFSDLREFMDKVTEIDRCRVIEGADWDLEIGAITELQCEVPDSPMLVFDSIPGYPRGYRVVSNVLNTPTRIALALGLPLDARGIALVRAIRARLKGVKLVPPVEVATGPVMENVHTGDDVNILEFPVPRWYELDGGRSIVTGGMVVLRDPDEGWVNLGCYRVQVFDGSTATVHIVDGHHGALIRRKYWERGLTVPAAIVCGQDPLLWYSSTTSAVPWKVSEYDYAGGLRNQPVEVVSGVATGLPIPATAEIVLEGEIGLPGGEARLEGPMGEWAGYVAGDSRPEPVFKAKTVLHRNDPIIFGAPVNVGPFDLYNGSFLISAAALWDRLDAQLPGIQGVWISAEGRGSLLTIVSIRQMYPGHAKLVGMTAASGYDRINRYVIVVDEDIDPSNIGEVQWAIATRCDPATSIDIIDGCWGMRSDPLLSPEKRARGEITSSRAIIYACKPYHWKDQFSPSLRSRPELLRHVREKFGL